MSVSVCGVLFLVCVCMLSLSPFFVSFWPHGDMLCETSEVDDSHHTTVVAGVRQPAVAGVRCECDGAHRRIADLIVSLSWSSFAIVAGLWSVRTLRLTLLWCS